MSRPVKPQPKEKKLASTPLKAKESSSPRGSGYGYTFGLPCSQLSADQNRDLVNRLIDALKTL